MIYHIQGTINCGKATGPKQEVLLPRTEVMMILIKPEALYQVLSPSLFNLKHYDPTGQKPLLLPLQVAKLEDDLGPDIQ